MDKYWTTRDGTEIKISEMTNEHILNAMAMLYKNFIKRQDLFNLMGIQFLYNSPGDMYESYDGLMKEARKRRIVRPATNFAARPVWNKPLIEAEKAV